MYIIHTRRCIWFRFSPVMHINIHTSTTPSSPSRGCGDRGGQHRRGCRLQGDPPPTGRHPLLVPELHHPGRAEAAGHAARHGRRARGQPAVLNPSWGEARGRWIVRRVCAGAGFWRGAGGRAWFLGRPIPRAPTGCGHSPWWSISSNHNPFLFLKARIFFSITCFTFREEMVVIIVYCPNLLWCMHMCALSAWEERDISLKRQLFKWPDFYQNWVNTMSKKNSACRTKATYAWEAWHSVTKRIAASRTAVLYFYSNGQPNHKNANRGPSAIVFSLVGCWCVIMVKSWIHGSGGTFWF